MRGSEVCRWHAIVAISRNLYRRPLGLVLLEVLPLAFGDLVLACHIAYRLRGRLEVGK